MKNLFKIASAAMLFVQTVKAQEVPQVPEMPNPNLIVMPSYFAKFNCRENAFKMRVILIKRDGDNSVLQLRILDKDGNWLYTKIMDKKEREAKVDFNLEELPDGTYTFELSNKYGKTHKKYVKETDKEYIKLTKQLIAIN